MPFSVLLGSGHLARGCPSSLVLTGAGLCLWPQSREKQPEDSWREGMEAIMALTTTKLNSLPPQHWRGGPILTLTLSGIVSNILQIKKLSLREPP